MIIIRRQKEYSGYSEAILDGATYHSAQIGGDLGENVLDPLGDGLEYVENLPGIRKSEAAKRKISRFKGIVRPLSKILKRNKEKKSKNK